MREVISVHVGQAGVQIGNACCMSFSLFFFFHDYTFMVATMVGCTPKRVVSIVEGISKSHDADLIIYRGALYR